MHSSDVNFASHFQINAQDPRSIKDAKENTTEKGFRKVVIYSAPNGRRREWQRRWACPPRPKKGLSRQANDGDEPNRREHADSAPRRRCSSISNHLLTSPAPKSNKSQQMTTKKRLTWRWMQHKRTLFPTSLSNACVGQPHHPWLSCAGGRSRRRRRRPGHKCRHRTWPSCLAVPRRYSATLSKRPRCSRTSITRSPSSCTCSRYVPAKPPAPSPAGL